MSGQSILTDTVSVMPFGKVFVYSSDPKTSQNLIIMISGGGGWKYGVPEFAREFSRLNSVVVGVDVLRYYYHLRHQNNECYMVSSDFVELATAIERKYGFKSYIPPVMMGYSSGATLVYGILAQSRPGTFRGGFSLGFCPDLNLPKMLCRVNGLSEKSVTAGSGYLLLPDGHLGNEWIVLQGRNDKICNFKAVSEFVSECSNSKLIALEGVGRGFSSWPAFMPQWKNAYLSLIKESDGKGKSDNVVYPDLPCIIVPSKAPIASDTLVIFFSGDGGWYSFEQAISDRLAVKGISLIGIDTKKYFWTRKTPEQVTSDISRLFGYFEKKWNITRFILIGYSQGAEILPFIVTGLSEGIRSKLTSAVMLSPDLFTDFEIHVSNMLGLGSRKNTFDVVSEMSKIKDIQQLIIFGEGEATSLPDKIKGSNIEVVRIPGDHHFSGNSSLIVETMKNRHVF
jgi:type IV secretory pathway VirJ component